MASLHRRSDGWQVRIGKRINGKDRRRTIRIGDMTKRDAEVARRQIETLEQCAKLEATPGVKTVRWLDSLPAEIQNRLADKGLCEHRRKADHTVAGVCRSFLQWKAKTGRKDPSLQVYRNSERLLIHFFGPDRDIGSIVAGEIDDFVHWVQSKGRLDERNKYTLPLAHTTSSRRLQNCKSIFRRAARMGWLPMIQFYSMFDSLPKQVRTNRKRRFIVPADAVKTAIEHAKCNEQRLIFALARWGGVRIPSELLWLTWDDVDREAEKILVRAPKQSHNDSERHERWIPIWPEIRTHLDIAERECTQRNYKVSPDKPIAGQHVIARYRSANSAAHRKLFLLACYRAGITSSRDESPWPKLWINMRSTRTTELRSQFPKSPDWVNYVMNHSEQISQDHYQQWETFEWRGK